MQPSAIESKSFSRITNFAEEIHIIISFASQMALSKLSSDANDLHAKFDYSISPLHRKMPLANACTASLSIQSKIYKFFVFVGRKYFPRRHYPLDTNVSFNIWIFARRKTWSSCIVANSSCCCCCRQMSQIVGKCVLIHVSSIFVLFSFTRLLLISHSLCPLRAKHFCVWLFSILHVTRHRRGGRETTMKQRNNNKIIIIINGTVKYLPSTYSRHAK